LIKAIGKDWNNFHLLDILTKVNECMANKDRSNGVMPAQVPYQSHTLRAEVQLGMKAWMGYEMHANRIYFEFKFTRIQLHRISDKIT